MEEKNTISSSPHKQASFGLAIGVLLMIVCIMFVGVMWLKTISIPACLIVVITLVSAISCLKLKYKFDELMNIMAESLKNSTFGLLFFIAIGGIIASWMMSGTVPAIIYYGLNIISPKIFLPAGLLLCSITALCTGTSWGTVGTIGIALIALGQGMGIPLPITAAMIVSGAAFGDKMSPVSDTPNLISMSCGADLYASIKAMITTMTPAYIISFILFTVLGFKFAGSSINYEIIKETQTILAENFNLNPVVLLPVVILLILSFKKYPSLPSMAIAIISGIVVSITLQGETLSSCIEALNSGFVIETGSQYVDPILNRGGLQSMLNTFSIAFLAICMGGLLDKCGYLSALVSGLLTKVNSVGSLSLIVLVSSFISTASLGEAYLSFILNGSVYKNEFDKRGLNRAMLARLISEGALMPAPLMPWTTFGAFCLSTLGISGLEFAPYAFLNYLSPVVSLIMAYLGIGVVWNNKINKGKRKFDDIIVE